MIDEPQLLGIDEVVVDEHDRATSALEKARGDARPKAALAVHPELLPRQLVDPLDELVERVDELPSEKLWVHCASGFRASIAASLLERAGRSVVLIDDDFVNADRLGLVVHRAGG